MINLWEKRQYKINFKSYQNTAPSYEENSDKDSYYEGILNKLLEEVQRFDLPMHDSQNRLIANNIREIVMNALTEEVINEEEK